MNSIWGRVIGNSHSGYKTTKKEVKQILITNLRGQGSNRQMNHKFYEIS